jgi:hypothetical protein
LIAKDMQKSRGGKTDLTMKDFIKLTEPAERSPKDLLFGIWGNVGGSTMMHEKVKYPDNSTIQPVFKSGLPQKHSTTKVMLRCLWTSFDYLSRLKSMDDFVIGGITDFRMFPYPEICKKFGGWTMRKVLSVEERLKPIVWPDTTSTMVD